MKLFFLLDKACARTGRTWLVRGTLAIFPLISHLVSTPFHVALTISLYNFFSITCRARSLIVLGHRITSSVLLTSEHFSEKYFNINILSNSEANEKFFRQSSPIFGKNYHSVLKRCHPEKRYFSLFTQRERVTVTQRYIRATVNHISNVRNVSATIACACMVRS